MKTFIFFALSISAAFATPFNTRADSWNESQKYKPKIECPENQDINKYFGDTKPAKSNSIKWTYITSRADWEKVKADGTASMLVVDVSFKENENIISNDFPLSDFLEEVVEQTNDENAKKYGIKYNVQSLEAFKNLKYNPERFNKIDKINMPPFPQIIHINADSLENEGYKLIRDISEEYKKETQQGYNCYTFSFGWETDECIHQLKEKDFQNLNTEIQSFENLQRINVVLDFTEDTVFDFQSTITYKLDTHKLKCYAPRSLQGKIDKSKSDNEDKYFDIQSEISTRLSLCEQNKGLLNGLVNKNDDISEVKWKLVTKLNDLGKTVAEDIVKIDVDSDKFLDNKNFKTVINKFIEKQENKRLMLNLKNAQAIQAFSNLMTEDLELIKNIPFGIQVDVDFPYDNNKWIDCYTAAIIPQEGGDGGYTDAEITALANHKIASLEKMYTLNIEKVAKSEMTKIVELLSDKDKMALKLNMPTATDNDGIKSARRVLLKHNKNTFVEAEHEDVLTKIKSPVPTAGFFEGIDTDKSSLKFVDQCDDLVDIENSMVQIKEENKIDTCLEKLSENNKNGLMLKLSAIPDKATIESKMKYRDYPLWIQLDIENTNFDELEASNWYHLVVGSEELDVQKLKDTVNKLKNKVTEWTVAIKANDYISNKEKVDEQLNEHIDMMISMKKGDQVVTSELRNKVAKTTSYFEYPHKFVLDECPKNDILEYFTDVKGLEENLSILTFSDVLKTKEQILNAIKNKKNMLNFEISLEQGKLVSDKLALKDLLTLEKDISEKFGLKLTFAKTDAFNAVFDDAFILESLRTMKRPIWINVIAVEKDKTFDLGYNTNNDLIDCRTLSLGFGGANKYSKENVEEMKKLSKANGPNKKVYVINLVDIGSVWETVKSLKDGGNYFTLLSTEGEAGKVDYGSMEKILEDNKNIFFFDFPDVVRKDLHGGCASVSASLFLASLLACFALIF